MSARIVLVRPSRNSARGLPEWADQVGLCGAFALLLAIPVVKAGPEQNRLAPARSLSISAHEIGSAGSTSYSWATSWGSYIRDFFTQQDVLIDAHNLSSLPAKIIVDFFFVGQPEHKNEPRKLFSRRTFTIDIPPAYLNRVSLRSEVLKSNEQRYVLLGEQYNSGYHITGWFLEASVPNDTTPFTYASSNPSWVENRTNWLNAAIAELERAAPPAERPVSKPPAVAPLPTTASAAPPSAAAAKLPTPQDAYVVTTRDVTVKLEYGEVVIRRGTRLRLVKRDASNAYVNFGNTVLPLSLDAVR